MADLLQFAPGQALALDRAETVAAFSLRLEILPSGQNTMITLKSYGLHSENGRDTPSALNRVALGLDKCLTKTELL